MLFTKLTAILGLAAGLTSAVNIRFYTGNNRCSGSSTSCSDISSNVCCNRNGANARSIRFEMNRRIQVRGYAGGACNNIVIRQNANPPFCMSRGDGGTFTGAGWGEPTLRKRGLLEEAPEQCPAGQEANCKETVRPDRVSITDGTEYDVKDLDEAKYEELVCFKFYVNAALADSFAAAEDVPEEFQALRVAV